MVERRFQSLIGCASIRLTDGGRVPAPAGNQPLAGRVPRISAQPAIEAGLTFLPSIATVDRPRGELACAAREFILRSLCP
jgi:hypothetical protein